jgi:hypothetical protein
MKAEADPKLVKAWEKASETRKREEERKKKEKEKEKQGGDKTLTGSKILDWFIVCGICCCPGLCLDY